MQAQAEKLHAERNGASKYIKYYIFPLPTYKDE